MRLLYEISVWLHLLAVIAWMGGMFFLILVVVPWLRAGNRQQAGSLLSDTGRRFRTVGWICFVIILATGSFNLWVRGVRFTNFFDTEWLSSPFGRIVTLKLVLFALILLVSAVHDFAVGPRATDAMARNTGSNEAAVLRRRATLLGRLNTLLALAIAFVGVMLVRGLPW